MLRKNFIAPMHAFDSPMHGAEPALAWADGALDEPDPVAQMALAELADRSLLRLVMSAAAATLILALACSLM